MTTTSYAAFYTAFFLHHCNVDRLYEAYLRAHPDSQSEFQRYNSREYNTELRPFVNKNTGDIYKHADLFDAAHLGYAYDSLPKQPRSRLREAPDYALFRGLDLGLEVFKDQPTSFTCLSCPKTLKISRCLWSGARATSTSTMAAHHRSSGGEEIMGAARTAARRRKLTSWSMLRDNCGTRSRRTGRTSCSKH